MLNPRSFIAHFYFTLLMIQHYSVKSVDFLQHLTPRRFAPRLLLYKPWEPAVKRSLVARRLRGAPEHPKPEKAGGV